MFDQKTADNYRNQRFSVIVALKNDEQLHTIHFRSHAYKLVCRNLLKSGQKLHKLAFLCNFRPENEKKRHMV